jgi:polysaccharide biosynthesis protein PslH
MRQRVLFLSCHLPWPAVSGGRRRELELVTRVGERFDVHLLVVSKTPEQDRANAHRLAGCCRAVEVFDAAWPPPDDLDWDMPLQVLRHRSRAGTARVREILAGGGVDLVHVEGFYLMQHVPESVDVPVLLVEQNIEYELEQQRARTGGAGVTRLDAFLRSVRTHAAELECWQRAARLATVTAEDRATLQAELPGAAVSVVPDGVDHLPGPDGRNLDPLSSGTASGDAPLVMLLANFGYAPNVDAAHFLCAEIMPLVRRSVVDVQLWLVGNAPPADVLALQSEQVRVTGRVPDVLPYLDIADVVVCPLRIGGGIKVKTIEALRRGKALVTTQIGAQGLPADARAAMRIADDPNAFAGAVAALLRDRESRRRLERLAARAAARLPTWERSAEALASVYEELLDTAPGRRAILRQISVGRSA